MGMKLLQTDQPNRAVSCFSCGQSRWGSSCLPQQFWQAQVLCVPTELGVIISLQYCI